MFDFENLRWNWKTFVAVLATESGILVLALLGSALFEADYHFPRAAIAILNALIFTVVVSTLYVRVKLVEKQFSDAREYAESQSNQFYSRIDIFKKMLKGKAVVFTPEPSDEKWYQITMDGKSETHPYAMKLTSNGGEILILVTDRRGSTIFDRLTVTMSPGQCLYVSAGPFDTGRRGVEFYPLGVEIPTGYSPGRELAYYIEKYTAD